MIYDNFSIWHIAFEIMNNTCPGNIIFNFCDYKNFFRPIWSISFSKKVSVFWYYNMITNLKFRIFIILLESIYVSFLKLTGFILIVLWYFLLYSFTISSNLSIYTFFDIGVISLSVFFFKFLINLTATTNFSAIIHYKN